MGNKTFSMKKAGKKKNAPQFEIPRFLNDPHDDIHKFYTFEQTESNMLGRGTFSVVYQGVLANTEYPVAIKKISKYGNGARNKPEMLRNEVAVLKKLENPYIIKLYDIFDTEDDLYLVMERVYGGELFERICEKEQYSETDAKKVMKQLLSAIQYFHSVDIVHRDLKPENILLKLDKSDTCIKVTDFGLSRIIERCVGQDEMMQTACGTPGYVAPEILKGNGYNKEIDMWSAGVIMYILLCGYPPFIGENEVELFERIIECDFGFDERYWGHISKEAKDLIMNLLVRDADRRFTADQALGHAWFSIDLSSPIPDDVLILIKKHRKIRKANTEFTFEQNKKKILKVKDQ